MAERILSRFTSGALAVGFAILILIAVSSVFIVGQYRDYSALADHAQSMQTFVARTYNQVVNAESGQRGYLLIGSRDYLATYQSAVATLPGVLQALRDEARATQQESAQVEKVVPLIEQKMRELGATVELESQGRHAEALELVRTNAGLNAMQQIRDGLTAVRAEQDKLVVSRQKEADDSGRLLVWVNSVGGLLILAIAVMVGINVRRYSQALVTAQQDLESANDGLEVEVEKRTRQLREANDEIQRYAYIVSHDLRAPLVNIMGFTGELEAALGELRKAIGTMQDLPASLRNTVEEDLPEAISFIRISTGKMDRLIGALLKLSREGRRVLTPEALDMTVLVQGIASSLQMQVEAAKAEVRIEPLPLMVADRLAIEQIFSNLMDNAIKYLVDSRPGRVTVRGRQAGDTVEYEVADNGRGISEQDRQRVFELFRRAGTQDRPGEGIGLAHVKRLVHLLGGTIELFSRMGEGSTFKVILPRQGTVTGALSS